MSVPRTALALVLLAFALAGCGGDDNGGNGGGGRSPDEQAIREAVIGFLIQGDCDTMTDKFVEAQTFQDDRAQGCEQFESGFQEPQYDADDVEITNIRVEGTRASATIGDDFSNVEAEYRFVKQGDRWRIDEVDL